MPALLLRYSKTLFISSFHNCIFTDTLKLLSYQNIVYFVNEKVFILPNAVVSCALLASTSPKHHKKTGFTFICNYRVVTILLF